MSSRTLPLADLIDRRQWVAWRNEKRGDRITKVPYCAPGCPAKSDDPATWRTHDEAAKVAEIVVPELGLGGGVGIVLGQCGELWLAGVDLDTCRDPATGEIAAWARQVVDRFANYTEISPSGSGLKIFFLIDLADVPQLRALLGKKYGRAWKRADGREHPPSIELYLALRYFAVTHEYLDADPAELCVVPLDDLRWLIEEAGPTFAGNPKKDRARGEQSGGDDNTILARLETAAKHNRAIETALRNAATMRGGSRSEGALGLGAAMCRAGWSYRDMKAALCACPATKEWASEKRAEGERQFERICEKAHDDYNAGRQGANDDSASLVLRIINPSDLEGRAISERDWIVSDWLPSGHVTANYGDGGTGKTLLAQQLMTSCAIGAPWCGLAVMRCKSFGVFCEDDEAELQRRQAKINHHLGIRFADLSEARWVSRVGQDNALVTFTPDGRMHVAPLFNEIMCAAKDFSARLVVLDTAADLFAGNENDRHQVRQFIGLLNRLALEIDGAVLLNAHPSRDGLRTGNLDGGSTAWNNSVRARWSLARPQGDEEAQPDTNERILIRRKANYASTGDMIRLRWVNGILVPVTEQGVVVGGSRQVCEEVFLTLLDRCTEQGQRLSDSKHASNYAPRIFASRPDREGYSARDFEKTMHGLFSGKRIKMQPYGSKGDDRRCLGRVPDQDKRAA